MDNRDRNTKISLHVITSVIVTVAFFGFRYVPDPFHRGFFCHDVSLTLPYAPDTISILVLVTVGIIVCVTTVTIVEVIHYNKHRRSGRVLSKGDFAYHVYKIVWCFLMGAAFEDTVANISKFTIGRLRPHFFAVCQPDYSTFNCSDSVGTPVYVVGDYCTGTDEKKLDEMRQSFFSGHASFAFYAMVYISLYLQARMSWPKVKVICPLLQFTAILLALYCSLSRISDYQHHWSDVLFGATFGTVVAVVVITRHSWFTWKIHPVHWHRSGPFRFLMAIDQHPGTPHSEYSDISQEYSPKLYSSI